MKMLLIVVVLLAPGISQACPDHWVIEAGAGLNDGVNWDDQDGIGAYAALRYEQKYSVFHITHGSQWNVNNEDESTLTHVGFALRLDL